MAGLLEKAQPEPAVFYPDDTEASVDQGDVEPSAARGRGASARKARPADTRTARRVKGRTIYLPDDLFERILVQAHRREKTISEYVTAILERQVPDHRVIRSADPAAEVA